MLSVQKYDLQNWCMKKEIFKFYEGSDLDDDEISTKKFSFPSIRVQLNPRGIFKRTKEDQEDPIDMPGSLEGRKDPIDMPGSLLTRLQSSVWRRRAQNLQQTTIKKFFL